jgi:spore cortex formation protein SpoVR/YcgB (stage V sporulation)
VFIGRAAHEATGFDKDALSRSMKISVLAMGPTTDFKQWKRNLLNFLSIKAAYHIPQLAIRDSGVWLGEQAQHYAYTLLLHAASASQRVEQAMKCVFPARRDCAAVAWDILCERLDSRSFARSLSLMDNLMVRQRHGQSLSDYVHYMRQTFDDYNETCHMVNGSAAIHPHNLGLLMLRGISNNAPLS